MLHPLFERRYLMFYLSGFLLFIGIQTFILNVVKSIPISSGLSASIAYNITFSVIGSSVWFVIKYLEPLKNNFSKIIFTHLAACFTVITISFAINEVLLKLIISVFKLDFRINDMFYMQSIGGFFYYVLIILFFYLIKSLIENKKILKNEIKLRALLREMELNLLKSQINPHFLFNSLNSISSLTITDAEKAQDMLIKLSEYLRYALKQKDNKPVTLKEELDNCNRYLEIEKIRFGDKLITNFDIEIECYTKKLPVLILQPLYENAVKHGVYESLVPVKITTKVYMSGSKMNICISNDYDNTAITRKGEGIGLDNVKTRLNLFYNKKSELIIDKQEDCFFTTIILPT